MNLRYLNNLVALIVLICLKAFSSEEAFSQSYIQNGSFEVNIGCPQFWSINRSDFKIDRWYSPTDATPDFFSKCSKQCNTSSNWIDNDVETSDEGYIGMILQQRKKNYSEYVQTKLLEKLDPDVVYKVNMRIYWPEGSGYGPVVPGVMFSSIPIDSKKETFISGQNMVEPDTDFSSIKKNEWINLEFVYRAKGDESYMTIGCFSPEGSLEKLPTGNFDYCYYFFDDISVVRYDFKVASQSAAKPNVISSSEYLDDVTSNHQPENCTCWNCLILSGKVDDVTTTIEEITDFTLNTGQRIDLNRVIFDYEDGGLVEDSEKELNRLLFLLTEQPNAELRFVIYTYPNKENAKQIAKESALAIYKYLKNRGLQNSFSYIHAEKINLSQKDGIPRDRNIEMFVVKN